VQELLGHYIRFKTDGSDRDHQHGMEALRAVLDARAALEAHGGLGSFARPPSQGPLLTLAQAIEGYSEVEAKAMKPNTWLQRRRALDNFAKAIGSRGRCWLDLFKRGRDRNGIRRVFESNRLQQRAFYPTYNASAMSEIYEKASSMDRLSFMGRIRLRRYCPLYA
jgi:hypothetical protein